MKIAITGGTGFVGGNLARSLAGDGHEVVAIARGSDRRAESLQGLEHVRVALAGTDDAEALAQALEGCDAVAHCAGINREIGSQTYRRVHVEGEMLHGRSRSVAHLRPSPRFLRRFIFTYLAI